VPNKTQTLAIVDWDDRSFGDTSGPDSFGFVYFNDGSRVGYAPGAETTTGEPVFPPQTNGGGKYVPVSQRHLDLAMGFLYGIGVLTVPGDNPVEDNEPGH
jgi:hypothetical protein